MSEKYPIMVLANHFQFSRGMRISYPRVQSRMLLWCVSGHGEVIVNRKHFSLAVGDFLFLPWNHSISYHPDAQTPYLVGGAHIIPRYGTGIPITYEVSHLPSHPLTDAPWISDGEVPGCVGVVGGSFSNARGLSLLADYAITWFRADNRQDEHAHWLGELLLQEITRAVAAPGGGSQLPVSLQRVTASVRANITRSYTMSQLTEFAGCSAATLNRLFRTHLQQSPMQWVIHARLGVATSLLMTTRIPISEIGKQVGIPDPYYFSKCFKRRYHHSPSAYRTKMSMLGT